MFESIGNFFKKIVKPENKELGSKDSAKERLHLVLMQDRANVSADFLELMKQEIIDVIKKYIVVDEESIDVRLTNKINEDGTNGAPALYANIPIINIKNDMKAEKLSESEKPQIEKEDKKTEELKIDQTTENVEEEKKNDNIEKKKENKSDKASNEKSKKSTPKTKETKNEEKVKIETEELELEIEADEDDDDVTFDDLLRAAEEADKKKVNKE